MSKIIGIDSGTGTSSVAVMEGDKVVVIPAADTGDQMTPSMVAFTKDGNVLVGAAAARQRITNPKNTCYSFKRLMGKTFNEVKDEVKDLPYSVVEGPGGSCRISIEGKLYSPEEITAKVLGKLKKDAEAFLGEKVEKAVITVPAYFDANGKEAVKNAGTIAGLEVVRIVSEPVAACMSYGFEKGKTGRMAVVDTGCGTTDETVLDVSDGVYESVCVNGLNNLGGWDFDRAIANWIVEDFKKSSGVDLSKDPMAMQRITEEAEKAKKALSTSLTYNINLPFITANASGPVHLSMDLTRAKFESLISSLLDRIVSPSNMLISDAENKIDDVIMVGGSSRIPALQKKIKEIFGKEPKLNSNIDLAVCSGAAIEAAVLNGDQKNEILLLDVTPLTLSICTNGELATPMIERNTTIPTKKTQTFSNATPMQSMATILVGQGERKMFKDNKLLGQFNVEITPCPNPGQAQIEITYDIDTNGILTVSAKDLALNKVANITITNSTGLSKEDIERAKIEAEKFADEDNKKVELVNTKNSAESMCNMIEKTIKDSGDKISDSEKTSVSEEISKTRESIKENDINKIKSSLESLNKSWEPVVSKLYPKQNGNGQGMTENDLKGMFSGGGDGKTEKKDDDGPINAEVVD